MVLAPRIGPSSSQGIFHDTLKLHPVNPVVLAKAGVLRGYDGIGELRRHLAEAYPILVNAVARKKPENHQVGKGRRHRRVNQRHDDGPGDNKGKCEDQPPLPRLQLFQIAPGRCNHA